MKQETTFEPAAFVGDTADLVACLRLTPMPTSTRIGTIHSVRLLRDSLAGGVDLPVETLSTAIEEVDPALAASMGPRWTQVRSDVRRALRAWTNEPRRALACRLRTTLPTLEDAKLAYSLHASADAAKRCADAINQLAASEQTTAEQFVATAVIVEPLLRAATPETFGVQSVKSCNNKIGLIRAAVGLVDPTSVVGRKADLAGLPRAWLSSLARLEDALADHATSSLAILRRLALTADRDGQTPASLSGDLVAGFVDREISTHAQKYVEKIRAAFRAWNASAEEIGAVMLELPATNTFRQRSVDWSSLPPAIREPVDEVLDRAISARAPGDWGDLVSDVDTEDADLGMSLVMMGVGDAPDPAEGTVVIESGTHRNWRDCIKRAYQAATDDPKVVTKPTTLADLYSPDVAKAMIRGARSARRDRSEVGGETFDPQQKGRYEHGLIEALHSVGLVTGIPTERLAAIETIKRNIDPAIVAWKRSAEGGMKPVYADRRMGKRHADMLRQFNEVSALRRWFEAPQTLWREAQRDGSKATLDHVALARSALIAQIGQRIAPLRRINYGRLRYRGPDAHLQLPVGEGHGWLMIPAIETKTCAVIRVRIDPETVRMLKVYIRDFLPIAQANAGATEDNPHLFPGADGKKAEHGGYAAGQGFLTLEKLNNSFAAHMKKYCRLRMCLHVMRHISGKVILDQDPSAMALVQALLGHRSLKTTQSYYAEVCSIVMQDRYLHLLEQGMRKALRDWKYSIAPKQNEE